MPGRSQTKHFVATDTLERRKVGLTGDGQNFNPPGGVRSGHALALDVLVMYLTLVAFFNRSSCAQRRQPPLSVATFMYLNPNSAPLRGRQYTPHFHSFHPFPFRTHLVGGDPLIPPFNAVKVQVPASFLNSVFS